MVDRFSNDRSDLEVENLILDLYTFATQNPWPEKWLDKLAESYHIPEDWREEDLAWLTIIKREVNNQFEAIRQEMELALSITRENDGPYHYADTIDTEIALLHEAMNLVDSWDELQQFMSSNSFGRLSGKKPTVMSKRRRK